MEKRETKPLRLMIVEDEADLREIVSLILGEELDCEFVEFGSGFRAIEHLETNSRIDLILSDFNMPNGNGAALEAYVRKNYPDIPFVLMTSNDRSQHKSTLEGPNRAYLQKPYRSKDLQDIVKSLLHKTVECVFAEQEYVPVSVGTLQRIKTLSCPLFLRLGQTHFVKLLNAGMFFDESVLDRLQVKGVGHLYLQKENLPRLLGDFKEMVFNRMYLHSMKERPCEALALAKGTKELLVMAAKTMNWSPDLMAIGNDNIRMVQNIVGSDKDVAAVFDWFSDPASHELGIGSGFLLTYLLVALTKRIKVDDPMALETLTLAAFFHDIALDEYHIQNQSRFINALRLGGSISKEGREVIRSHPEKGRLILSDWKNCSPDVLRIIEEHHERPDGTGFPKGLKDQQLHSLSKIFIIANEVNESFHRVKTREAMISDLQGKAAVFKVGECSRIFSVMLDSLEGEA